MGTSQIRGKELERETREILKLFPGSIVEGETVVLGKKVDAICTIPGNIAPSFRIAVECKNWSRALTRAQCSRIISDYREIVDRGFADQLLLITAQDIVPNARDIFDGQQLRHLTLDDLADKVFDPSPLVADMFGVFYRGGLDRYYVPARGHAPDMKFISENYDSVYNDFMDFVVEVHRSRFGSDLFSAIREWKRYSRGRLPRYITKYSEELFNACLRARMYTEVVDLEEMVMTWANDESRRQIAVLGSYGTGKSTFARRIASRTASEYRKDNSRRIPFLIELKEFGSHQDIRGLITHELVNRHHVTNGSFEAFETFNRSGRLLLILDGFDEMKQGLTVDSLLYNFNQIFSLHEAKSKVLLCGRPTLFENESEQNRILSGRALSSVPSAARYINLQMAPPSGEEVCSILINFAEVNAPATLQHVRQFVDRLKVMTRRGRNGGLVDLVSRPVHLPMLVSIMQRREVDPEKLDRATLYREFIDAMIERETLKRQAEFQSVYSADVRRRFAQDLAVEMWTRGEHRTIRASEIPARLVEPFVGPGRPLEAVRRDLMASGFFERKPPDILFVPHKSFLEYLVAERVFIDLFLTGPDSTQDLADIELSEEVMTFLFDMMGPDEWSYAFENWKGCRRFLRQWGRYLRLGRISLSPDAEVVIAAASRQPNVSVLISLLTFYDAKPSWRTNARRKIIAAALMSNDDHVVVHAYRALIRGGSAVSQSTIRRLGVERMWRWVRLGWIALPPDEIAERGNGPAMRTESPHLERVVRSRLASLIRDRSLGD